MNGVSLGIRSGSYSSSDKKQQQSDVLLPIQTPSTTKTKPYSKMFKDKEKLFRWASKFAGRKRVRMSLLFAISAAVFVWVLYVGRDKDQETHNGLKVNDSLPLNNSETPPMNEVQTVGIIKRVSFPIDVERTEVRVMPPQPPSYFLGYTLPPGHPCNSFSLPPPPADKNGVGHVDAIALMPKIPSFSPVVKDLTYVYEENLNKETEFGGSDFGGYPTLKQRDDSYDIRESMNLHCGFVKGSKPGHGTGFDIDDNDLVDMEQCRGVVVASAIFGAFDVIQQAKNISEYSKRTICFYMFVDEETEADLKANGGLDETRKIGVWRIVVVRNLPYTDGRRNGKIPKLLTHRLFPNARFSLWIDGKLELVVDPYQILERFLWRTNATFAISRHYKRFDVFDEAEANKAAGKYDNASIDFQVDFYKKEGLTPYSEAKLPITSDVPEGCVIIREHIPISNLFSCLWFNEVDRFTSRDQISFSTVRDKIAAKTGWMVNMLLDCERRNFVVQQYHKEVLALLAQMAPPVINPPPPPTSSRSVVR
ncbi:hypothetical protein GOBAR_DD07281 [Gossypium barbadense]|nr:hypothetical protein GOBAR_DD07281 [Gossypium barbadense]